MRHFAALLIALCCTNAPLPAPAADAPMAFVQRKGRTLAADGKLLPLVGINRYELAGGPQAASCQHWGGDAVWWRWATGIIDQTEAMGGNVIRLWAFQNYAGPSGKDFGALDRVIAYAQKKKVRLILVLENQWGDCTQGGIKTASWFSSGYKTRYGYPLDFVSYVKAIVTRYKDQPAIAMWEVINEGKLDNDPTTLRRFIITIARLIKSIDKKHLVAGGGALQCWEGQKGANDFKSYYNDAAIDVLDHHQYDEDTIAWPVCAQRAERAARELGKPLIIGESGIKANLYTSTQRGQYFSSQIKAAASRGLSGFLIWQLNLPGKPNYDNFDFWPGDPTSLALGDTWTAWFK